MKRKPHTGGPKFEDLAEPVLLRHARLWKPSTLSVCRSYLRNQILPFFGALPVGEITHADVRRWFASLGATPAAANRSLPILVGHPEGCRGARSPTRKQQSMRRDQASPAARAEPLPHLRRNAAASVSRLTPTSRRAPAEAAAVRLLLLTGARQGEVRSLQWRDYREGNLYLPDGKAGPRTVWLSSAARTVLDSLQQTGRWVFPRPCGSETYVHRDPVPPLAHSPKQTLTSPMYGSMTCGTATRALRFGVEKPSSPSAAYWDIGTPTRHSDTSTLPIHSRVNRQRPSAPRWLNDSWPFRPLPSSWWASWKTDCYACCKPSTQRRVDGTAPYPTAPPIWAGWSSMRSNRNTSTPGSICILRTAPGGANRALDRTQADPEPRRRAWVYLPRNPTATVRPNPRPRPTRFLSRLEDRPAVHCASITSRPRLRPTAVRHHPPAPIDGLPQGGVGRPPLVRGGRRCPSPCGQQNGTAHRLPQRTGASDLDATSPCWTLRVPGTKQPPLTAFLRTVGLAQSPPRPRISREFACTT